MSILIYDLGEYSERTFPLERRPRCGSLRVDPHLGCSLGGTTGNFRELLKL